MAADVAEVRAVLIYRHADVVVIPLQHRACRCHRVVPVERRCTIVDMRHLDQLAAKLHAVGDVALVNWDNPHDATGGSCGTACSCTGAGGSACMRCTSCWISPVIFCTMGAAIL